jgi:large subunit ribosomal protein L17
MKHRVAGRKLGRSSSHRLALLRNLSTELFRAERIRTTLGKAKELRPFAEKLLTLSKRETLHARRLVARHIHDRDVVAKLFDTLSARFAARPGGYTRIVKLGPRRGDNAEMALVELVGAESVPAQEAPEAPAKGKRKAKPGSEGSSGTETATPPRKKAAKRASRTDAKKDEKSSPTKVTPKKAARKAPAKTTATRKSGKSGS